MCRLYKKNGLKSPDTPSSIMLKFIVVKFFSEGEDQWLSVLTVIKFQFQPSNYEILHYKRGHSFTRVR